MKPKTQKHQNPTSHLLRMSVRKYAQNDQNQDFGYMSGALRRENSPL